MNYYAHKQLIKMIKK